MLPCPRRREVPEVFVTTEPSTDKFEIRDDDPDHRFCSYCGSLDPEQFMAAAKAGVTLGPTDKNYKVYVDFPGKTLKFYFQYLSEDQMSEFVALLNQRVLKLDFPGRFYVLPFFCGRG